MVTPRREAAAEMRSKSGVCRAVEEDVVPRPAERLGEERLPPSRHDEPE